MAITDTFDIVRSTLADRIAICVVNGLCSCADGVIDPSCQCHSIDNIALNDVERSVAGSVITTVFAASNE